MKTDFENLKFTEAGTYGGKNVVLLPGSKEIFRFFKWMCVGGDIYCNAEYFDECKDFLAIAQIYDSEEFKKVRDDQTAAHDNLVSHLLSFGFKDSEIEKTLTLIDDFECNTKGYAAFIAAATALKGINLNNFSENIKNMFKIPNTL